MDGPAQPAAAVDILPMTPADVNEAHRLERVCFTSPWSRKTFRNALSGHDQFRALVARGTAGPERGMLLGYAAWFDLDREYHLISLASHPSFRRRGIAGRLLSRILDLAGRAGVERITLEVRSSNSAAISFYGAKGFIPVALRRDYYLDTGEDAVVMWLDRRDRPER